MLLAAKRQNGPGEDSSGQDMKKKMRWDRIEDAERMRSRADGTAIAGVRVQRANHCTYTTGPAAGSDWMRDLSLGSAGRDPVLQLTVSGA